MNIFREKRWRMVVVFLVVVGGGYGWYRQTHPAQLPLKYVTALATRGTLVTSIAGSGNVVIDAIANVDPTITGTVANLAVAQGDSVHKGQVLFTIDNDQFSVSLAQAQSSLQSAQTAVDQAKTNLYNAKRSAGEGERDRNILQQKISLAEQSLTASRLSYQKAVADAAKRSVVAPIDGTVSAVNIKNGDDLGKSTSSSTRQAPIIIGDLGTLQAQVAVNEVDIIQVALEQKVMLRFDAIEGLTLTGKVEKIDALGTITQGVVTYNVLIGFDRIDPRIKPQMSVSASIITGNTPDVLLVPNAAVKSQGNTTFVQVMRDGGATPEQVTVQTGAANMTETEITSGLSAGDKVVTQTVDPNIKTTTTSSSGVRIPGLGGGR